MSQHAAPHGLHGESYSVRFDEHFQSITRWVRITLADLMLFVSFVAIAVHLAVKLYRADTGEAARSEITALAISSDGSTLATGCTDGSVKLWDVESRHELATIKTGNSPVHCLAIRQKSEVTIVATETAIQLWRAKNSKPTMSVNREGVDKMVLSRDGSSLVTTSYEGVEIWNSSDLSKRFGERRGLPVAPGSTNLRAPKGDVAISNESVHAKWGAYEGTWDIRSGKPVMKGKSQYNWMAPVFPNGGWRLDTRFRVQLWQLNRPWDHRFLGYHEINGEWVDILASAISPTSNEFATGGADGAVILWNADAGERFATFRTNFRAITALTFTRNGNAVVIGGDEGSIELWDIRSNSRIGAFPATPARVNFAILFVALLLWTGAFAAVRMKAWKNRRARFGL